MQWTDRIGLRLKLRDPAHSACRREIRQHGKSGRRSRHFAALCVQGDHREAISETVVGNRWLMSALRAHQIHYGNERTARIVDTYVVDCHILTVAKPEVRELRTEGLVLIDCRRAVEGRPEESEASGPSGLLRARRERPRRQVWLRIFVVRCGLPCDPPVGGHSCHGGMISRFHRAVSD